MKKRMRLLIALVLAAVMLCGCDMIWSDGVVAYEDMEYVRPDMAVLEQALDEACQAAKGEDLDLILEKIYAFYDEYDWFYTCYSLADLRYCHDVTDIYWEDEYDYCMSRTAQAEAALEALYYALAKSPCREELEAEEYFGAGYFDYYEEGDAWDEELLRLMEAESDLQGQYYDLYSQTLEHEGGYEAYYDAFADEMAQLLVELIRVRQEIAAYWGYDDYTEFAADYYYYRDYTPAQSAAYLKDIQENLVPLYRQVNQAGLWEELLEDSSEKETYAYVREMAGNMGGTVADAFDLMDRAGLYDISYSENKYAASYEVYLTSYWEPFIFLYPELSSYDKLAFAHEFGHFCNDYASYGSYAGTDVLEVFSQGMEYLSLCYVEDTEDLTKLKMVDSLFLYVEQAAFASFEQQMYGLTGDGLTVEALYRLYGEVAGSYGFDSVGYDKREFVDITHFYTNPMYIISYVVSNDAAMQLYQMELTEAGAGLACFEENLTTQEQYFLAFLESAGLESPFAEGRMAAVKATFEEALG